MKIEVIKAEQKDFAVVKNLVCLYVYDMSEHMGWVCPENGKFDGCDDLPQYWDLPPDDPRYLWPKGWLGYSFLVRVDGKLAGFALVKHMGKVCDIGEFFIIRRFRGKGVGAHVAHAIFDKFPGNWQVRELPENEPAIAFWRKAIASYTNGKYTESKEFDVYYGGEMVIQRFLSPQG